MGPLLDDEDDGAIVNEGSIDPEGLKDGCTSLSSVSIVGKPEGTSEGCVRSVSNVGTPDGTQEGCVRSVSSVGTEDLVGSKVGDVLPVGRRFGLGVVTPSSLVGNIEIDGKIEDPFLLLVSSNNVVGIVEVDGARLGTSSILSSSKRAAFVY